MSEVTIEQLQLGGKGHTKLVCERCGKPISYKSGRKRNLCARCNGTVSIQIYNRRRKWKKRVSKAFDKAREELNRRYPSKCE